MPALINKITNKLWRFRFLQNRFYGYRNCDSIIQNCYHQNCKRRGGHSIRRPNVGMLLLATGMLYILGLVDCLEEDDDLNNEEQIDDENDNEKKINQE